MNEPEPSAHSHTPVPDVTPARPRVDLPRVTLGVLCIGGLLFAALWVLSPFIGAAIWAAMIVVATWPLMRQLQARLWNRRGAAVAVMTLALLVLFVLPVTMVVLTLVQNANEIGAAVAQVKRGVDQIAAAAQEAVKASEEAAAAARQQAQGAEELSAAIEEISSLADELQSA